MKLSLSEAALEIISNVFFIVCGQAGENCYISLHMYLKTGEDEKNIESFKKS